MPRGRRRLQGTGGGNAGSVSSQMLANLNTYRQSILDEIANLQRQANALTDAMSAMGATAVAPARVGRPVGRPPGKRGGKLEAGRVRAKKGSLKECIRKVLSQSSKPVPVKDMITGVRRVGYKTNSNSLGNQISMALRGMSDVKRVGHGLYALGG